MRLIISYTILALIAAIIISSIYNYYIKKQYQTTIANETLNLTKQVVNNYEIQENAMKQVAEMLLSDQETLNAIRRLSKDMGDENVSLVNLSQSKTIVRRSLNTAYNIDNFYRIIVFNRYGYIASSVNAKDKLVDMNKAIDTLEWLELVTGTKGRFVSLGVHQDDWKVEHPKEEVYSLVKEIQGDNLGFIEIQITDKELKKTLEVEEHLKVFIQGEDGRILFASEEALLKKYEKYFDSTKEGYQVDVIKDEAVVAAEFLESAKAKIVLVRDWKDATKGLVRSDWLPIAIVITFMLFSLVFISLMANFLTKPIRRLREQMERTELSNIYHPFEVKSSDADIQALTTSYRALLDRVQTGVAIEKKLIMTQMQTQFDMLQAQINPHFIYNVLSVISNRGMKNDDEVICEICGNLAAMLRYSTDTKKRYATIEEEIQYLNNYVFLLKSRFQDRLRVEIDVDQEMLATSIPKVTIQQLVENSLEHGYGNSNGKMEIKVKGRKVGKGWEIEVCDKGVGISHQELENIKTNINRIKEKMKDGNEILQLEIGGMGLVNTYGRLFLLYKEKTIYQMDNLEEGGLRVVIGVKGGDE